VVEVGRASEVSLREEWIDLCTVKWEVRSLDEEIA
jgi:hypothetical protein